MNPTPSTPGYAENVVAILAQEFPDLRDPVTAEVAKAAITEQVRAPRASFEFIVDNPIRANWRLKASVADRRRVRLSCFARAPSAASRELELRVNTALAEGEFG